MMENRIAKELAAAGHNLIITGQAGTGKTTLLKAICNDIGVHKNIQICASTGIATLQFSHALTLHSWCGIRDGRYSLQRLVNLLNDVSTKCFLNFKIVSVGYLQLCAYWRLPKNKFPNP